MQLIDYRERDSAHNPEDSADADAPGNPDEQVDAVDITHDPAHGCDIGVFWEQIRVSKDRRAKFAIFNRRCFSNYAVAGYPAFTWRPYSGENPHDKHGHLEIDDRYHDQVHDWKIRSEEQDMTPGQAYKQHVHLYRNEAMLAMRENVVVPKFEVRDEAGKLHTFPGFTEVNQLAVAINKILNKPASVVDVEALARELDELIDQGATEEQIRALLNGTRLQA